MEKTRALDAFAALAHETRLDIVRQLVPKGHSGMNAGEIGRLSNVSASRLSFHLAALENAGLITSRRESRNVIYRVQHQKFGDLISYLMNDCCGADPQICACMQHDSKL